MQDACGMARKQTISMARANLFIMAL